MKILTTCVKIPGKELYLDKGYSFINVFSKEEAIDALSKYEDIAVAVGGPGQLSCDVLDYIESNSLPLRFIWFEDMTSEELFSKIEMESVEITDKDVKFVKVGFQRFARVDIAPCDVFIKLSDSKTVKVMNKGEKAILEILEKYKIKEIKYFYVRKSEHLEFQNYFYGLLKKDMENALTTEEILEVEKSATQHIQESLRTLKINKKMEKELNEIASLSIKTVKHIKSLRSILKNFDKDGYLHGHSLLLSYVANMVAMKMDWRSSVTYEKLSIASIMHDAVLDEDELARIDELAFDQEQFSLDLGQVKKVKDHPLKIYEMAIQARELPPDVADIVFCHHERPDGTGFPRSLSSSRVPQIACLFIIAEDFTNRIYGKSPKEIDFKKIAEELQEKYEKGNYRDPLKGMLEVISEIEK